MAEAVSFEGAREALERGGTLPWRWYSDAEILRLEQERIFRRAWQYAGHAGQVAEPGDFFTCRAGDVPIVVTRARDGELRAFLNVCRHRGFAVARGEGRRETLQCGYHAWTYGLDGKLRAAPRSDREPGFDREALGLVPVSLGTWGPFLFVNPDPDAAPLADTLGRLPELVAQIVDVDSLRFHHRWQAQLATNWKISCENFLECYHCAVAHPSFSAVVDVSPDAYRLEEEGLFSSQFGPLRDEAAGFAGEDEVPRSQFHFLWPNVGLNVFPGRPNLSIGPMLPLGPERTERYLDYFFAPDADEGWIAELLELDAQVGREDTELVETVQRGMSAAGLIDEGRLLTTSERLIQHFQRLTFEALAG
ncbi:MAG: choline monooxygenase [Gaiellaceae bacterium]|nr:choline monooxygenase [Gaiellaceae bacterium]